MRVGQNNFARTYTQSGDFVKRKAIFRSVFLIVLFVPVFFCGKEACGGIVAGIRIAGATVIPALFPYFVLSSLLIQSGLTFPKGLQRSFQKVFRTSAEGLSAFVFSLIGGYPLGAKTVSELYVEKRISNKDAAALLRFCNNTGPAFFLGVAGEKILGSTSVGAALYCIHILSAVLCGLLFRPKVARHYSLIKKQSEPFSFSKAFPQAVLRASTSMLNISAFVILFSGYQGAIGALVPGKQANIALTHRLSFPIEVMEAICSGSLEMTSGIIKLRSVEDKALVFALLSLLISWGGMCVHFQTLSQLDREISTKGYYAAKLSQALISWSLALPIGKLLYHERLQLGSFVPLSLIPCAFVLRKLLYNFMPFASKNRQYHKNIPKIPRKRGRNSEKNLV